MKDGLYGKIGDFQERVRCFEGRWEAYKKIFAYFLGCFDNYAWNLYI